MPRKQGLTGKLPPALGPLSRAIRVGDRLYISGVVGVDANGKLGEGVVEQTRLTLEGIKSLVEAAGGVMDDIVTATIYLPNPADFKAMNSVYVQYFKPPLPARACVACPLVHTEHLVEIQAIAELGCSQ